MTLLEQLTALLDASVTIQNGVIAQLTREAYYTPYTDNTNPELFVPIVYFNITLNQIGISNTLDISFSSSDIFSATDWIILNQTIV